MKNLPFSIKVLLLTLVWGVLSGVIIPKYNVESTQLENALSYGGFVAFSFALAFMFGFRAGRTDDGSTNTKKLFIRGGGYGGPIQIEVQLIGENIVANAKKLTEFLHAVAFFTAIDGGTYFEFTEEKPQPSKVESE